MKQVAHVNTVRDANDIVSVADLKAIFNKMKSLYTKTINYQWLDDSAIQKLNAV